MLKEWYEDARKRYKIRREAPRLWHFPEEQFGYMQIRKVASTSISNALLNSERLHRTGESFQDFKARCSVSVMPAEARRLTAGSLVFAFVRHPLGRLHSAYLNKIVDAERLGDKNTFRCHGISFGISFEAFVQRVCELNDRECDRHLRSQSWFLADERGLVPSFIGRLETFAADWERLRAQLPALGDVGHSNKAAHGKDFREFYTPRMLEIAQARYEQDFRLFGYAFL